MNLADLKAPFDPERISWRVGSTNGDKTRGLALAYLDSRDVQDRLDAVCGPENWQCRYSLLGTTTICEIGLKIGEEWVWKADGAGATDFEAEKGALSDAMKRAAVKWGIGRYLYDLDAPWVAIEAMGKSFRIRDTEKPRLFAILKGQKPPIRAEIRKADEKNDAESWVNTQIERIFQMDMTTQLNDWETQCEKALIRLAKVDQHSHERLMEKVRLRYEQIA